MNEIFDSGWVRKIAERFSILILVTCLSSRPLLGVMRQHFPWLHIPNRSRAKGIDRPLYIYGEVSPAR